MQIVVKKTILNILFFTFLSSSLVNSQIYLNHFGTGNSAGVTVTSSDSINTNEGNQTLTGTGYLPDIEGASRFLAQAALGANYEEMEYVTQMGISNWIDEQMSLPYVSYEEKSEALLNEINLLIQEKHPGEEMDRLGEITSISFYKSILEDEDVLRNKVAFSLLQILVVSRASIILGNNLKGHMSYYDILYEGAFSNYRDILENVTLHAMMGFYLSHLQNKKADPSLGTLPDENYAREIMQLFSIGLFELNVDGTYKFDENGEKIPTYNITDVQELAKVFTGLSGGAWNIEEFPQLEGRPLEFDEDRLIRYDVRVPMIMYDEYHEQGEKILPNGTIIPAGQPGMQDIQMTLDYLFNHSNVGPFVAKRMIQQMVKSNPSPAYVKRVALAFNNNGKGVRGDMAAVIKSILLDPEARNCEWIDDAKNGKLRQPIERMVQLYKAFDISSPSGRLWLNDKDQLSEQQGQAFMMAPSVFNFYTPFYAEDEYVEPNDMVSPEFQILHAVTTLNYINMAENAIKERPFRNRSRANNNNPRLAYYNNDDPFLDFSDELQIYQSEGLSALLDRLNLLLCHGQMSDATKNIIQNALVQLENQGNFSSLDILENALYFIMVSPNYIILK